MTSDSAGTDNKEGEHKKRVSRRSLLGAGVMSPLMLSPLRIAGLPDDAASYFQRAIDANPKFALPYNNLAWLLATSSNESLRNPSHAVELAQKAVELDPKLPGVFNTLGVAQYRVGDWEGAIQSLQKGIKNGDGGNAFDWFFLAMANQRLGRNAEARDDYEKAVDWMLAREP